MPHTLKDGGGIEPHHRHMPGGKFTDHVFGAMKEKGNLAHGGPFGTFFLRDKTPSAPSSCSHRAPALRPSSPSSTTCGTLASLAPPVCTGVCRSKADLYLHEWAQQQAAELPWLSYVPVLSDAKPEDQWTGRTGFVHQAVLRDLPICLATRCMPVAPHHGAVGPTRFWPKPACLQNTSTPTLSPAKPTNTDRPDRASQMSYDTNNIFAKILRGEIPASNCTRDEHTLAFMDIMPQTDGHALVIPKSTPPRSLNSQTLPQPPAWPPCARLATPRKGPGG